MSFFGKTISTYKFDGFAWKRDLMPFLQKFVVKFIENLI